MLSPVELEPGVFDITMNKGVTGVGFCLEGGLGSPRGNLPITIKRIFKGNAQEYKKRGKKRNLKKVFKSIEYNVALW